jgi:hypothetical protein
MGLSFMYKRLLTEGEGGFIAYPKISQVVSVCPAKTDRYFVVDFGEKITNPVNQYSDKISIFFGVFHQRYKLRLKRG